jgi:hypothetical protein
MELNENSFLKLALSFGILIISFSVCYYFFWALPNQNKQKSQIDIALKQQELDQKKQEENQKRAEDLNRIKQDCLLVGQKSYSDLEMASVSASPMFFPYFNESSFESNVDLTIGISAYMDCVKNYPSYSENSSLKDMYNQAEIADRVIVLFISFVKNKISTICDSYSLSERSKSVCINLDYTKALNEYLDSAVDYGKYSNREDGKKEMEDKLNSYKY